MKPPLTQKSFNTTLRRCITTVAVAAALLFWANESAGLRVSRVTVPTNFNQSQNITITFNASPDRRQLEQSFTLMAENPAPAKKIPPPVEGVFTWRGKTVTFTPNKPLMAGTKYTLSMNTAGAQKKDNMPKKIFTHSLQTPATFLLHPQENENGTQSLVISPVNTNASSSNPVESPKPILGNIIIDQFLPAPDGKTVYLFGRKNADTQINELFAYTPDSATMRQITGEQKYIHQAMNISPNGKWFTLTRTEVSQQGEYLTRAEVWLTKTGAWNFQKLQPVTPKDSGGALGTQTLFTPDSQNVLYKDENDNFHLMDIETKTAQYVGNFSQAYALHPSKPIIAFTSTEGEDPLTPYNHIVLIHGDGTRETVPLGRGVARDTIFSPNGETLVVTFSPAGQEFTGSGTDLPAFAFHLFQYDLVNKTVTQLTTDFDYNEEKPAFSPDGKKLFFIRFSAYDPAGPLDPAYRDIAKKLGSSATGDIWEIDTETGNAKLLLPNSSLFSIFSSL